MAPRERALRLYGAASEHAPLAWSWVEEQLTAAGTYWLVSHGTEDPHPRPVWGAWSGRALFLSVGSPRLARTLQPGTAVTVHLDSGTEVVILQGTVRPHRPGPTPSSVIGLYNAKYDWDYQVAEHGELTAVEPATVMAWRSTGWAGRDGFTTTGCWEFDPPG